MPDDHPDSYEDPDSTAGLDAEADAYARKRLAELYDPLDPDRSDLEVYVGIVAELGARRVLDVGCGTGTFALMLAGRGIRVVGVDPDEASVDVARHKPDAGAVQWIVGDATELPPLAVDLATMTANVAQVFTTDAEWAMNLAGIRRALVPGGVLVFETRDPARRAWEEWTLERSRRLVDVEGVGPVETWQELVEIDYPLVTFRETVAFAVDGSQLAAESTLRWRSRDEVEASLRDAGFELLEVREAPDRPGREQVYLARKPLAAAE